MTPDQNELITVKQAAELLHVAPGTIYQMVYRREIPSYKSPSGQRLYFKRSELLQWATSQPTLTQEEIEAEAADRLINGDK